MEPATRRRFIEVVLGFTGWSVCSGVRAAAGAAEKRFEGCFLRAVPAGEFLEGVTLVPSTNDKEADQVCRTAEGNLRRVFGVSPELGFFDDGSEPNAFATPLRRRGSIGPDGTVAIGLRLVATAARRNELNRRWPQRLTAIVAHEWAHIVQYSRQYRAASTKAAELHADFLAGWFLGRTTAPQGAETAKNEAMYRFFFLGDTEYTNPTHHGTPMERVSAITNGFDLAATVDKLDVAFGAGRF